MPAASDLPIDPNLRPWNPKFGDEVTPLECVADPFAGTYDSLSHFDTTQAGTVIDAPVAFLADQVQTFATVGAADIAYASAADLVAGCRRPDGSSTTPATVDRGEVGKGTDRSTYRTRTAPSGQCPACPDVAWVTEAAARIGTRVVLISFTVTSDGDEPPRYAELRSEALDAVVRAVAS